MGACIDPETLSFEIREAQAEHPVIHLAVSPEWYDLAQRKEDPYTGRTVLENYKSLPVAIANDVIHPRGAEVRIGPSLSWSDPASDPMADIKAYGSATVYAGGKRVGKTTAYSAGALSVHHPPLTFDPPPFVPPEKDWNFYESYKPAFDNVATEPEVPDHLCVSPTLCQCDMNLCECNTPDPGPSFEEHKAELRYELHHQYGMDMWAIQNAINAVTAEFRKISATISKIFSGVLRAQRQAEARKRPAHAGPPPPPKPLLPLASVHTPGPHAGAARARHRKP